MRLRIALTLAVAVSGCTDNTGLNEGVAVESAARSEATKPDVGPVPVDLPGPCGTEMGMTAQQLRSAIGSDAQSDDGEYAVYPSAPKPHASFDSYAFLSAPGEGLCKIVASGPVTTNRFGSELQREFDNVKDALVRRYGEPSTTLNHLMPGSIWNEPEDFTMGMAKGDRKLASLWSVEKRALPNDLSAIVVEASASGPDQGKIQVAYEYSNFDNCIAAYKKKADAAL